MRRPARLQKQAKRADAAVAVAAVGVVTADKPRAMLTALAPRKPVLR
jgi:hypothetical protein